MITPNIINRFFFKQSPTVFVCEGRYEVALRGWKESKLLWSSAITYPKYVIT